MPTGIYEKVQVSPTVKKGNRFRCRHHQASSSSPVDPYRHLQRQDLSYRTYRREIWSDCLSPTTNEGKQKGKGSTPSWIMTLRLTWFVPYRIKFHIIRCEGWLKLLRYAFRWEESSGESLWEDSQLCKEILFRVELSSAATFVHAKTSRINSSFLLHFRTC